MREEAKHILFVCNELDDVTIERLKPTSDTPVLRKWHGGALVFLDVEEDFARRIDVEFAVRQAVRQLESLEVRFHLVGHTGCKCARVSRRVSMSHLAEEHQVEVMKGMLELAAREIKDLEKSFPGSLMREVTIQFEEHHVLPPSTQGVPLADTYLIN